MFVSFHIYLSTTIVLYTVHTMHLMWWSFFFVSYCVVVPALVLFLTWTKWNFGFYGKKKNDLTKKELIYIFCCHTRFFRICSTPCTYTSIPIQILSVFPQCIIPFSVCICVYASSVMEIYRLCWCYVFCSIQAYSQQICHKNRK